MALIIDDLNITDSKISVDIKDSTKYGNRGTLKLYIGRSLVEQKEITIHKNFQTEELPFHSTNSYTIRVSVVYGDQKAEIRRTNF